MKKLTEREFNEWVRIKNRQFFTENGSYNEYLAFKIKNDMDLKQRFKKKCTYFLNNYTLIILPISKKLIVKRKSDLKIVQTTWDNDENFSSRLLIAICYAKLNNKEIPIVKNV